VCTKLSKMTHGKFAGPDEIRKPHLLVDVMMSTVCLKQIFQPQLTRESYLPSKSLHMSPQCTQAEINWQQVIITYHLLVPHAK